ncbi:protein toll-like [Mytilus californianus]|uniref:protein toll-like n=1 Tax=Mytilus californianus TaxID=6549 RepID=UPI002247B383|nr:protein toll-like [Mytilus californianus]
MNFSHCGISEIPVQLYDWGLFSKKLKIVDLSHNKISDLGSFTCHSNADDTSDIFDLQFNNITTVKLRSLTTIFRDICSQLTVNIRNNPFACDCEIKDFLGFLDRDNYTDNNRYRYLSDLTCLNPPSLRGQIISQLSLPEIGCETVSKTYLKGPIIGLCCLVFVFSICIIIGVRYKKEIVILAYTRLHILLPCQQYETDDYKKYDAFIAYSQADIHWVIHTLAKRLENPESGPNFSLCLHHRDFMVGAAISDNIVRSVENSRHTIIVVSKQFLKSEWCLLEFRTALHQSILEKKRHLIILLLEDIPTSDFEPELRSCMQTLTYVKTNDCWFWDKLIYALSDWSRKMKNEKANTIKRKIIKGKNNLFEGKINV